MPALMEMVDFTWTDLGTNSIVLKDKIKNLKNSIFLDLGVRGGISSAILLTNAHENKNKVFGVDIERGFDDSLMHHPLYTFINKDSISTAKQWTHGPIECMFVDTVHVKEQVLLELYHWWPHLSDTALIVFHDTAWDEGKFDSYAGKSWLRPEHAVLEYFDLTSLNYEDSFIKAEHYPASNGMTFIQLKNKSKNFGTNTTWEEVKTFPVFIKD